jgi:hypothetical protein
MKIYRHAYIPVFDCETKEYSWKKVHVVKVWVRPTHSIGPIADSICVEYVLENCMRVSEHMLTTDDNKDSRNIQHQWNLEWNRALNRSGFIPATIFQPAIEMRMRGEELQELIKQSQEQIKYCIEHDEILGEESVLKHIKDYI